MSYIALARKWRPRTFSQLVGQEQINKALINSLTEQRLHHAYLFTGTRGVGKTSIARLFAKSLNCENGVTARPCLQCEACQSIEQNRFIDLIEIDGASKTRVEDTREILENVQYAPTSGRYKIYIIDEVHMLSQHSFNALLKTLEEPPAHVKFLLATTDPQKLPVTVLSRCLQFNLKPLSPEIIASHLQQILSHEQLSFESQAVDLLAKAARGSMRDALSLLDQAIAIGSGSLQADTIKDILGYTQQDYALLLLESLAKFDAEELINISRKIATDGGSFHYILEEMQTYLHQILLSQNLPNTSPFITPQKEVLYLGKQFTPEDAQLFYQIALNGIEEIQLAPTQAIGFEMTVLRMYTFRPAANSTTPKLAFEEGSARTQQNESSIETAPPVKVEPLAQVEPVLQAAADNWQEILLALKLSGFALSAAENSEFLKKDGARFSLGVASGHRSLFTPTVIGRLEQALSLYYGESIKVSLQDHEKSSATPAQIKQMTKEKNRNDAEIALQQDPFFQQLQKEFSAEVIKNSITPQEDSL